MQKGDNNLINFTNKVNVLNLLWKEPSIFRAEIARCTNLSIPTVMKIIDDMSEKNLVKETGKGVSSGGKPPVMLEFNKDAYYVIGVDINEYWTEVVLVNLLLGIEEKRIQDIRTTDQVESVIQRVIKEINTIIEHHPDKRERIIGIGIGVPGLIDSKRGYVAYSPEMGWQDVHIKEIFQQYFDGEIVIEERTRAMALAEMRIGKARGVKNFLYINISSGIGSAIVMDGKLYYGSNKSSGRLGHMVVEKSGSLCNCGNHGCLELYASGNAIAEKAKIKLMQKQDSLIYDLVFGDIEKTDMYIVFEAARNNDRLALEILNEAAEYLGMAVTSVVNFMDPQFIIFEGKVCRTGDILMKLLEKNLKERYASGIEIMRGKGNGNMASMGAATFILENFLARGGEYSKLLKCMEEDNMIPGSKGHAFHACMKKHDVGTRKT